MSVFDVLVQSSNEPITTGAMPTETRPVRPSTPRIAPCANAQRSMDPQVYVQYVLDELISASRGDSTEALSLQEARREQ